MPLDLNSAFYNFRYGELSPSTFPGKLIGGSLASRMRISPYSIPQLSGGLCALCGIFILTLPIPIVVNSFASYYKNRLWRNEVHLTFSKFNLFKAMKLKRKVSGFNIVTS